MDCVGDFILAIEFVPLLPLVPLPLLGTLHLQLHLATGGRRLGLEKLDQVRDILFGTRTIFCINYIV